MTWTLVFLICALILATSVVMVLVIRQAVTRECRRLHVRLSQALVSVSKSGGPDSPVS